MELLTSMSVTRFVWPSRQRDGEVVYASNFEAWHNALLGEAGGSTVMLGFGYWTDPTGAMVQEDVDVVEVWGLTAERAEWWARRILNDANQAAVGWTHDGRAYMVYRA